MKKKRETQKQKEQREISHAVHGYDMDSQKGVEILAGSGIKDINPEITKGVEIHDSRNG